jgi:hypothetical protein
MSRSRISQRMFGLPVLLGAIAACSVINAYDDVVPNKTAGGGSANAGTGAGDNEAGNGQAEGGSTSLGGQSSGGGTAPVGGEGGSTQPGGPTTGLVVLGGKAVDDDSSVLSVLNPLDGNELARETIPGAAIVGLAYDGAPAKNLWFLFTSSDFPADAMSKADLQVRTYDDVTAKWATRKKVSALPPPRPGSFVVLNDRLAYLSFGLVNGALTDTLTILDTSSADSVKQVTFDIPLSGRVLGLVGTRGAPGDATALGGTLAIATADGCAGTGASLKCTSLSLTPIFVGDDITPGVAKMLRGFLGRPAFASSATEQRAFVALPAATVGGNIDVIRFDPRDLMFEQPLTPPTPAKHLAALAIADCIDVTVFSSVADTSLWATSAQGTSSKAVLAHEAQDVVYEPFTSSVVAPYNPDSPLFAGTNGAGGAGGTGNEPEVHAFKVARSGVTASIKARTADWAPPSDVAINVVAARYPVPFVCPQ